MGEEEFYIDNITNLFIEDVLTEEEKEFNLNILTKPSKTTPTRTQRPS